FVDVAQGGISDAATRTRGTTFRKPHQHLLAGQVSPRLGDGGAAVMHHKPSLRHSSESSEELPLKLCPRAGQANLHPARTIHPHQIDQLDAVPCLVPKRLIVPGDGLSVGTVGHFIDRLGCGRPFHLPRHAARVRCLFIPFVEHQVVRGEQHGGVVERWRIICNSIALPGVGAGESRDRQRDIERNRCVRVITLVLECAQCLPEAFCGDAHEPLVFCSCNSSTVLSASAPCLACSSFTGVLSSFSSASVFWAPVPALACVRASAASACWRMRLSSASWRLTRLASSSMRCLVTSGRSKCPSA